MNAAYKWRLDNGVYAYLVDETGINGPFIYYRSSNKRVYDSDVIVSGDTGLTVNEVYKITNDIVISSIVDDFNEAKYVSFFNKLYNMVMEEYPNTVLLDASYYYNIGINECSDSGSSELEYDILFNVANTETSDHSEVRISNINTNPYKGDLKYDMYFKLEKGEKGDVPVVNATASAKMIEDYKEPKVKVTKSGDVAEPTFNFNFEIPSSKGISSDGSFRPVDTYEGTEDKKSETVVDSNGVSNMEYYPSDIGKDVIHNETTQTSTGITSTEYNENGEKLHETIINSSSVTTEHIYTQELVDNLESKTINETGWYRVYEGDFCTTARLSISRGPNVSENYYLSFNFGAKDTDNVKPYSDSITLINGSFDENNQCVDKVRIVNHKYGCLVDVHINKIDEFGSNVYKINNVQGVGKVVNFGDSRLEAFPSLGKYITRLDLINGISTINNVKCNSIINNDVKYQLKLDGDTNNGLFFRIYEYRTLNPESISGSVKMSINLNGVNEGYTFLLNIINSKTINFTQLSGSYVEGKQRLKSVNLFFLKNQGYDIVLRFDSSYRGGDIYVTLVEGKGKLYKEKILKNFEPNLDGVKEFDFKNGFYNNIIECNEITCNNISFGGGETINDRINSSLPVGSIIMFSGDTSDFNGSNIDSDWRLCDGKEYFIKDKKSYLIKEYIGNGKYKVHNTNGNLIIIEKTVNDKIAYTPDLRGRFIVGVNTDNEKLAKYPVNSTRDTNGKAGLDEVTLTTLQMPTHTHTASSSECPGHNHRIGGRDRKGDETWSVNSLSIDKTYRSIVNSAFTESDGRHSHTITINSTGSGEAHENRPPFYSLYYIIKIK